MEVRFRGWGGGVRTERGLNLGWLQRRVHQLTHCDILSQAYIPRHVINALNISPLSYLLWGHKRTFLENEHCLQMMDEM